MNQEQLMKFTLHQMEKERKSSLKNKTKKSISKLIGNFFKILVVGTKSKIVVKGESDND
jgi:hypothetical protein